MRDVLYCPGCQRRLQLPDDALGQSVQCPACQRVFVADASFLNPPPTAALAKTAPAPGRPAPRPVYDEDPDRGRNPRRRDDDPDRSRGSRRPLPHRGGEILTFGLLAILPCPLTAIIFGIIAWMMAVADLAEMRSGRMDRDGEGLTQAGRALGIVGLFLINGVCGVWALSLFMHR